MIAIVSVPHGEPGLASNPEPPVLEATPTAPSPDYQIHLGDESKSPGISPDRSEASQDGLIAAFVGPDAFGYSLTDSIEADGPVFEWLDISSTGTDLNLVDDSYAHPVSLPFEFEFYGQIHDVISVGSNGVVYFSDAYLGLENTSIPEANSYSVSAYIAVYWDDLDPDLGGAIFFEIQGEAPYRQVIVQWQDVPLYGQPGETLTAQVVLFEGRNDILVQYQDLPAEAGASATEGIQGNESTGLLYGYNQVNLSADLALCYAYPGNAKDCTGPGLVLEKTVGLDVGECSARDMVVVTPGSEVAYCYRVDNTSAIPFTRHDLVDNELGTLLSSFPLTLDPGAQTEQIRTAIISESTMNNGSWTAYNPGPTDVVTADDTATVLVPEPAPIACDAQTVQFTDGIPSDWSIVDDQGGGVVWTLSGEGNYPFECSEPNHTGGSGRGACVSSEFFVDELFDSSLVSPVFSLLDVLSASLKYKANYQNFANLDHLDLDISEDGGSTWTTLQSWNEDHGADGALPGEEVEIDLNAYIGEINLRLRWRYYISTDYAWYAQIDDISLDCAAPSIAVVPAEINDQVYPDQVADSTVSIQNNGTLDLNWTILEQASGATPCSAQDVGWLSVNPVDGTTPGSGSLDVQVSLDASGLSAGDYDAEICVSSDDPLQPQVVVPVSLTVEPLADLSIVKTDSNDPAFVHTEMQYTLTVTNIGPSEATNLVMEDHLPSESVFVGTIPGSWSCSQDLGLLSCSLNTLPAGNQAILQYSIELPGKVGPIMNQASVSGDEFDPDLNNNSTSEETLLVYRRIFLPLIER